MFKSGQFATAALRLNCAGRSDAHLGRRLRALWLMLPGERSTLVQNRPRQGGHRRTTMPPLLQQNEIIRADASSLRVMSKFHRNPGIVILLSSYLATHSRELPLFMAKQQPFLGPSHCVGEVQFNVSHSGNQSADCSGRQLGVDI
jgi:phosphopantetheinyl transferase